MTVRRAWVCPTCGEISPTAGWCPFDQTRLEGEAWVPVSEVIRLQSWYGQLGDRRVVDSFVRDLLAPNNQEVSYPP